MCVGRIHLLAIINDDFFFLQYKKVTITTTSECIIVYGPMVPEMKLFYSTVAKILLPIICAQACMHLERRGSVVVNMSAWHAAGRRFDSRTTAGPGMFHY